LATGVGNRCWQQVLATGVGNRCWQQVLATGVGNTIFGLKIHIFG